MKEHVKTVCLACLPQHSIHFYSSSSKPIQSGIFLIFSRRNSNECESSYSEMVSLLGRRDQVSELMYPVCCKLLCRVCPSGSISCVI